MSISVCGYTVNNLACALVLESGPAGLSLSLRRTKGSALTLMPTFMQQFPPQITVSESEQQCQYPAVSWQLSSVFRQLRPCLDHSRASHSGCNRRIAIPWFELCTSGFHCVCRLLVESCSRLEAGMPCWTRAGPMLDSSRVVTCHYYSLVQDSDGR